MDRLHTVKTREVADTPLVLFDCVTGDGTVERWATHISRDRRKEVSCS